MMKRYVSSLFILLNLFLAVVQAAEWEVQSRSIQFQAVWGSAKNDVFALGHHGVIFHYDGTHWKEMDTGTVSNLYGLWGSSGRDVFAVGVEGTILHYDGNTWTTMNSGTIYPFSGVWGSSSRNLFAVGDGGTLFHYDGQTWSAMNSGTSVSLKAIWGSSSNDVFVVGDQGTILHYNGKDWSTMNSGISTSIYSIWGSSNRDVFAVTDGGVIFHYDGSSWKTMDSGTALPLSKIWGSSSSDVFAVGGGGIILHYDGSHWTPMEAGANYYLNGVWGSSSRDVFVVGNGDTILHYDGSLWNTMKRGAYVYLNDIWGISSRDLFAIGNSNQVFHYDGNQWTTMNSGSPFYLKGIWGTSGKEVFAVGGRVGEGEIIQYDGNNWTGMDSGTTSNLNGIGGNSSSEVFTVGDNGTILRYDGSRWKPMTSGTSAKLTSIWSNSSREVFAVGDSGTILQYNGSRWATMNSGTTANLSRVWGNTGNDVFAVGDKGTILHYDGQTWTAMDSGGTEARLTGVWGNSNVDVFALNWDGLILHYDGNRWTKMTEMPALLNGLWISPEGDAFAVGDTILYCANCQLGNSAIKVAPKLHNFWNIALNEVDSQTFTISNTGSDKLQLKPLALTNATEFSLSNDTCSNAPIAPAGTCQVDVNFQPQSIGTKITKLTLPSQTETFQIPIGGTGCSITFQQVFNPYPKSPNFGAVWVGDSMILNQTVNLTAIQGCGEELYIDKIEVVGEHAAEFSLREMTCDYSKAGIQSYSNCQFNIVFTPTSAGDKQAELNFKFLNHEDLPAPPITIQASGHTESILGVEPQFHDFWNIALGQTDSQIFTVSNSGNIDAQLQQLTLTDATTEFSLNNDTCSNKPLAPTNTCQVTVNFQPQTEGIKFTKLNLPSATETLQVPVSGTGCSATFQQVFNLYPELPNFGAVVVGGSITLNQTVNFTAIQGCSEELYIESIGVMGKHATEFSIQDTQCSRSTYGKESYSYCQFKTVFMPTSIGDKQVELIFKLSRAELPGHVVSLPAEGIDSSLARLELTPTEHDFGTVFIGRGSTSQSFAIKNTGAVSLKLGNMTLTGEHAADFSLESWSCNYIGILQPGGQCDINAWFRPTTVGQKQARLTITLGGLTAEALIKGIAEEPKDCSDANITVKSAQNGRWDTPATWSTSQIPTETDVVLINQGHTISGQAFSKVRTFCIQEGGILESADEIGTPLEIQATDYLENQGVIRGKNGASQTKPVCGKADIGTLGCAQSGASVLLKVGTYFDKAGKLGDWWWWGTGGPILNTGEIIAGKGGDGSQYGAPGGSAIVLGRNTTNIKRIQAGDGGNILGTELGEGGLGGLTQIWGKLGGPGHLYVQNGAQALAGKGGNCNPQGSQQTGGSGGNLWLVSLPDVHIEGGITEAGRGGQGCTVNGQDGFIQIEPNVISLAGAATQVSGGNIAIYGGNDWTLDLSNLSSTVVEATGDITLAVGKEGLIDFRNSTGKIFKANGEVQIFANNILLDPKKTVLDYIEAKNVVLGPSRLLRNVSLTGPGKLFGRSGDTLPIQLILANNGPEDDNYLVTATDSTGQNLGQLPQPVPVKGLETVNVEINTVIPATNPIMLTATSQTDPETKATTAVFVEPAPVTTDNSNSNPNVPDGTQPDSPINPDGQGEQGSGTVITPNEPSGGGETGSNPNPQPPVVNLDSILVEPISLLNTCSSTPGTVIDWMCLNHGQILTDVTLEANAKVSGGKLAGTIDNQGFVSQVTIQPDTILTGGKLSGYIVNQGTLMDFEFVGAQVTGGTLAGQVINNSLIGGVFKDVHLAANAHLSGGYLQGEIQGEPAAPALLEDLTIQSGSHLAYVKIGKNVTWSAEVVFEDNVQFIEPTTYCNPIQLAEITPLLPSLDVMVSGTAAKPCSQLVGGVSTDGKQFQRQLTITRADSVEVMGRVAPDLRQVNQVVEWVLFAAYRAVETEPPLYFMVDAQGRVLPWDGEVSQLVAFKESVRLESVQSIRLYRGRFPAKGQLEIQFGYRLVDGTVVLNAQPLEVVVVE